MMHILHDEDEWQTVSESRPCTVCNGDPRKCNGTCNGSLFIGTVRRPPAEVAAIKARRQREHDDAVLAEAEAIKARRASIAPDTP
jgi:hypothetical protein